MGLRPEGLNGNRGKPTRHLLEGCVGDPSVRPPAPTLHPAAAEPAIAVVDEERDCGQGAAVRAGWDAERDTAMCTAGRAVFEEQLIGCLLQDLA